MFKYAVISAVDDGHIPFVEKHLDAPFVVIDPGGVVRGIPLSYRAINKTFEAFYDNQSLAGIAAVWFRRPELGLPEPTPERKGYNEFIRHSMAVFMGLLYGLLPKAIWVSDYYTLLRASDKLWQLTVANQTGFRVPDTLITSSPTEAEAFAKSHPETIVKSIETKPFTINGQQRVTFTQRIDRQKIDFSGLHLAPAIIQEAIDADADIRVTVVGNKVFAATVRPKTAEAIPAHIRDCRAANQFGGTDIQAFDLPTSIAKKCIAHVKAMGLKFGAIDLILDKKGKFWFLENNPNGQWAFVEVATGQPIGKAVAELLMTGK